MAVAMDKCTARVRVRDAHRDDVKVTTIKKKEKEKEKIHGDFYKPKSRV